MAGLYQVAWACIFVYYGPGLILYMLCVGRHPADDRHRLQTVFVWLGSEVSPGCLLQNSIVEGLISHYLPKAGVFLLQSPQLFDHIRAHAAVFPPPTVIRVLADVDLLADFRDTLSLTNEHISLPELGHNLGSSVFLLHETTLSKTYFYCRLSSHEDWISFQGAGQARHAKKAEKKGCTKYAKTKGLAFSLAFASNRGIELIDL